MWSLFVKWPKFGIAERVIWVNQHQLHNAKPRWMSKNKNKTNFGIYFWTQNKYSNRSRIRNSEMRFILSYFVSIGIEIEIGNEKKKIDKHRARFYLTSWNILNPHSSFVVPNIICISISSLQNQTDKRFSLERTQLYVMYWNCQLKVLLMFYLYRCRLYIQHHVYKRSKGI